MNALNIAMRVIHILSAIALVGGTMYVVLALAPTLRLVDEQFKESLLKLARRRFFRIVHPAITLLLVTGAYNWYASVPVYRVYTKEHGPLLQALLGFKVMLAVVIAVILFAEPMNLFKGDPLRRSKLNLTMGITIVILAGIIRALRLSVLHT